MQDDIPAPKLTEQQFRDLLNDNIPLGHWRLQLGVGLKYEGIKNRNVRYSAPYPEMGMLLWNSLQYEIYDWFCDRNATKPKEWLNDLMVGDIRNLIVGIVGIITSKYDVTLGIAVPATALILKTGVLKYCAAPPQKQPPFSVKELLNLKDRAINILKQKSRKKHIKKSKKEKAKRKKKDKLKKASKNVNQSKKSHKKKQLKMTRDTP